MKKSILLSIILLTSNLILFSMEERENPVESENFKIMMNHYKPSANNCRARVRRDGYIPEQSASFEVACLVAGFRDLIIEAEIFFDRFIQENDYATDPEKALKKLLKENIESKEIQIIRIAKTEIHPSGNIILFKQSAAQRSFLFAKSIAEGKANWYMWGLFLGYRLEDIEFFYKMNGFNSLQLKKLQGQIELLPNTGEFFIWPQKLKEDFYEFEKNIWPNSKACKEYETDKLNAEIWLEKNKDLDKNKSIFLLKLQPKTLSKSKIIIALAIEL